MYISLAFVALLATGALANVLPMSMSSIPEELRELVPEEVKNFYKNLTTEERQILREVVSNHAAYPTEDAAMEALKEKSETLHNKAAELRNLVKEKVQSLKPEAKQFVEELIAKARSLRPPTGQKPDMEKVKLVVREVTEKYKALTDEVKEELKATFPQTAKIISNEKFKKLIKGFLEKN